MTCAVVVAPGPASRVAWAAPTADQRAARAFEQGQKAFKAGDYRKAGENFEQAYEVAPHPSPLWNAARAWHRAQELVRAAKLYAKYLRIAPDGARDRNHALAALKELSAKLGQLSVTATDVKDVHVDGKPLEDPSVYVLPGEHIIEGRYGESTVRVTRVVAAGEALSVALVPPPPPPPPPPVVERPRSEETKDERKASADPSAVPANNGLSPAWFFVGLGATAVVGGIATWSGVDTLQRRDEFDGAPSQNALDDGRRSQTRTNILLGATAGVGVVTVVLAFIVDWRRSPERAHLDIGPSGATFGGAF
jgi:hypothetical protein